MLDDVQRRRKAAAYAAERRAEAKASGMCSMCWRVKPEPGDDGREYKTCARCCEMTYRSRERAIAKGLCSACRAPTTQRTCEECLQYQREQYAAKPISYRTRRRSPVRAR